MDPWVKGYAKATLWLKNEGYPSKRIKQLGSLAEAVQAQESRRRTRERTCFIYMHPTDRMSKEDGRLTGGRFQFASDPVAFEVKRSTTTTYQGSDSYVSCRPGSRLRVGYRERTPRYRERSLHGRLEAYRLP